VLLCDNVRKNFMTISTDPLWLRYTFCAYGILSLSSMAGMSIGAGALLAACLWAIARSWQSWGRAGVKDVLTHPLGAASAFLFAAAFLSLAHAWISPPLGRPVSGFGELKKFHHFLYPFVVALALHYSADALERHPFWKFWGGMGIFCGLLAGLQFFGRDLFPSPWLEHRFFRAVGETGRFHGQGLMFFHLSFASCLTFVAAAGLARIFWPLKWDQKKEKIFWFIVAVAGFSAVFFSFSRIALVGLLVVGVTLAFLRKPLWGLISTVLFSGLGLGLWWLSPALRDRFLLARGGVIQRERLWEGAWAMFVDRPFTGFGFGRSGSYTPAYLEKLFGPGNHFTSHAHNNFLDLLASTGLIGLLAFLFWWGVLFVSAGKSFRAAPKEERWLPAAAIASLLAFQVNGLTQVNFADGKSQHTLFLMAGVVLALAIRRKKREALAGR
jgi:hypothetical protein